MALALLFTRWGGDASSDLLRRIGFDVLREATAGFAEPGDHDKRVALTAMVECTCSPGACAVRRSCCSSPRMPS
jgi:hypothetical protein